MILQKFICHILRTLRTVIDPFFVILERFAFRLLHCKALSLSESSRALFSASQTVVSALSKRNRAFEESIFFRSYLRACKRSFALAEDETIILTCITIPAIAFPHM